MEGRRRCFTASCSSPRGHGDEQAAYDVLRPFGLECLVSLAKFLLRSFHKPGVLSSSTSRES